MPRQRRPVMGIGIMLLANRLLQTGISHIPPVTLLTIFAQIALFLGVINPPWTSHEVCLSGEYILYYKDYRRLFLSAIEHVDDLHLYHNMASLILKGRTLESRHGSLKFTILLLVFIFSTSGMYVALAKGCYMYFDEYSYMKQCAIGFSGVLFALKVLTTFEGPDREHWVYGFHVPSKYVVWVELIIIHILVPGASFMGHLAGILVGILYMQGPLRVIVDVLYHFINNTFFAQSIRGGRQSYTYDHGSTSQHHSGPQYYGWNNDIHPEEPVDPDEMRRRRMNRFT